MCKNKFVFLMVQKEKKCVHGFVRVFVHVFVRVFVHVFVRVFVRVFVHVFVPVFLYVTLYAGGHVFAYTFVHMFIHTDSPLVVECQGVHSSTPWRPPGEVFHGMEVSRPSGVHC